MSTEVIDALLGTQSLHLPPFNSQAFLSRHIPCVVLATLEDNGDPLNLQCGTLAAIWSLDAMLRRQQGRTNDQGLRYLPIIMRAPVGHLKGTEGHTLEEVERDLQDIGCEVCALTRDGAHLMKQCLWVQPG